MIRIQRPPAPQELQAAGAREQQRYADWLAAKARKRNTGKPFEWRAYKLTSVRQALAAAFAGKCAYCENRHGAALPTRVDHYRPKGQARYSAKRAGAGYPWLAAEWTNLLPSCERCNSPAEEMVPALGRAVITGKSNWFPLWKEAQRAKRAGQESREYPLIMNPCVDDPAEYLEFDDAGLVAPKRGLKGRKKLRAEQSILILGLGRERLVIDRDWLGQRLKSHIRRLKEDYGDWLAEPKNKKYRQRVLTGWAELANYLSPNQPYSLCMNQLATRAISPKMRKDIERLAAS